MSLKIDGTNGVLQAYDYQVLTTGFSYTFAAGVQLLLAVPAGTLATGTVTMPANPVDGMNITITSTQQITALTVNGNTGQSIVGGATSLKAGGTQTFVYRLSNTTWYNQNNNTSAGLPGAQGQVFTSTGTFTVPAGVTAVKVTVIGGGGGGGNTTGGNFYIGSGGGGGGGVAVKYITGLTPGATITATVGGGGAAATAGGTSSFGAYCSATGGGAGTTGSVANTYYAGGTGGAGSSGDFNYQGSFGVAGSGDGCNSSKGGAGGGSGGPCELARPWANSAPQSPLTEYGNYPLIGGAGYLGGKGGDGWYGSGSSANHAGSAATGYGNGGAGASKYNTNYSGGAGSAGCILVEW